ncbi:hypothetical protein PIB30_095372, partial [Stylosanthes scabra]|nr:hypothetical protein [Stylosanthes scabra]
MGDFIEEKLEEHPILWCELNKTVVVSTLEVKPEKLIEGKASQDGVLNATTTMSTHSKENSFVSSEGLRYVPRPLRQATKRGRNSPWIQDKKGKKKNMKTNGVAENVSYMEWNHSTNLSVLKGQPLEFHHDHSHNKGVDAYLVKDTSKWNHRTPIITTSPNHLGEATHSHHHSSLSTSSSNIGSTAEHHHYSEPPRRCPQLQSHLHHSHHHLNPPPPSKPSFSSSSSSATTAEPPPNSTETHHTT